MKKIFIGTKNYLFPSRWNDLTTDQLLFIANTLSRNHSKQEIVVMFTVYFSGLKTQEIAKFNPTIFIELEHQYDFLFKDIKLTKQLLPELRIGFKKFEGPKQSLVNMTYEQFIMFSETYYILYTEKQNEDFLDLFIASLYTPKNKAFDNELVEKNAKILSKLSNAEKTAILIFYQGNRRLIANKFPDLFTNTGKGQNKDNSKEYDFLGIIELLNKEDVSKNNAIRKTNIYEIFTRLTNLIKSNER